MAQHLRGLGLRVRTGIAGTGVVAELDGAGPGPVIGLRADMDALPIKENTQLVFASRTRSRYRGTEVDVMHACGHDGHTAILMAVADVLTQLRSRLPGTVVFYVQPAEEGPSDFVPDGTRSWGARLMIEEGVLAAPRPDAVLGLHLTSKRRSGQIAYRPGPLTASSDDLRIKVFGQQTHAASPWHGVDPIVLSAHAITALQTVVSRECNANESPTVLTIGTIHGGVRNNILAPSVEMEGTLRTFDRTLRTKAHSSVRSKVAHTIAAGGGRAEVEILEKYSVTVNDPALTDRALPALRWAANGDLVLCERVTGSEDFSCFADEVPGLFFLVGAMPQDKNMETAAPNHSAEFDIDESALQVGVRALCAVTVDLLRSLSATDQATRAKRGEPSGGTP